MDSQKIHQYIVGSVGGSGPDLFLVVAKLWSLSSYHILTCVLPPLCRCFLDRHLCKYDPSIYDVNIYKISSKYIFGLITLMPFSLFIKSKEKYWCFDIDICNSILKYIKYLFNMTYIKARFFQYFFMDVYEWMIEK